MSNNFAYASVSEIHGALVRGEQKPKELYDYLTTNYLDWKADNDGVDKIRGSESDFHNLTVEFSRQECEPYAADVALMGVEEYPLSTDLIADMIKYAQETGNKALCKKGLDMLQKIDRKYWTWRTFVFAIDFLKDGLSSADSVETFETNLNTAKALISDFKMCIPYDERSYVAEAEFYENQGKFDEAMTVLENAVKEISVAPQCCLKLADMKLKLGLYNEVEIYARKGILMATQNQPTVSVAYLYYLQALAMDANRIKDRQENSLVEDVQIRKIVNTFRTADRLFLNDGRKDTTYRKTIRARLIAIEMEEGISAGVGSCGADEKQTEKLLNLSDLVL